MQSNPNGPKYSKFLIGKAIDFAKSATILDKAHNYQSAVENYQKSCEFLLEAYQVESNPEEKRQIFARATEMLQRAELLKQQLSQANKYFISLHSLFNIIKK